MPVVVNLAEYKRKGTLTAVRELLVLAARGQLKGLRFEAQLKDGRRKRFLAGEFAPSQSADVPPDLISLPVRVLKD